MVAPCARADTQGARQMPSGGDREPPPQFRRMRLPQHRPDVVIGRWVDRGAEAGVVLVVVFPAPTRPDLTRAGGRPVVHRPERRGRERHEQTRHPCHRVGYALAAGQAATDQVEGVYGALRLQLAVIAARTERAEQARQHLARSREVADRLGRDRNDYQTEFGPTNVALHEVAVAVDLGDAGEAIRRASTFDASGLSAERQGRMLIDVASAWTQWRNVERALAALEDAERIAPEQAC